MTKGGKEGHDVYIIWPGRNKRLEKKNPELGTAGIKTGLFENR